MKLLFYEWKKLWKEKLVIVSFLLLFLLNIGFILLPCIKDTVNEDYNYAITFYTNQVSGKINKETFNIIKSWEQKLKTKEVVAISGDVQGDTLIIDHIKEEINQQIAYTKDMKEYTDKLQDNLSYFEKTGNQTSISKNQLLYQTYQNRGLPMFDNHKGWDILIQCQKSTLLLIMFVIVAIPPVWSKEREEDMVVMLLSTKKGQTGVNRAKLLLTISLVVASSLLFAISEGIVVYCLFGLKGASLPIYVQESYRFATMNVTNFGFWISSWVYKLFSLLSFAMIALVISKNIKSILITTLSTVASVVVLLGLAESGVRLWNPLSGFYLYQTVCSQSITCILSQAVYAYHIGIFASVLCIALCLLALSDKIRRKPL